MFNTLASVLNKKRKALQVFESAKASLLAVIAELNKEIEKASGKVTDLKTKISKEEEVITTAQAEIESSQKTISKIQELVG